MSATESNEPIVFIVMGVSACGKSTIGDSLAKHYQCSFKDGDQLHPKSNIEKMSKGTALTDDDRWPWLEQVRDYARENASVGKTDSTSRPMIVIPCSALKKSYRELLRDSQATTVFVFLKGSFETLNERMKDRGGHFMKSDMLKGQIDTLESPEEEEGVLTISIEQDQTQVIMDTCHQADDFLRSL